MTRASLMQRWLAGESLSALQSECAGSAEDAARDEARHAVETLQAALAQVLVIATAFDDAASGELDKLEREDWAAGYRSGLGAGFARGAYAMGTLFNWVTGRMMRRSDGLG